MPATATPPRSCDVGPTGVFVRPVERRPVSGVAPYEASVCDAADLGVDYPPLKNHIWPTPAHRMPAVAAIRQVGAGAGLYEDLALDRNAVPGPHPKAGSVLFATGFSGHGLRQAPTVGRAIAEWIVPVGGCRPPRRPSAMTASRPTGRYAN